MPPEASSSGSSGTKKYVDVSDLIPEWSAWSNNPDDMEIETYFSDDPENPGLDKVFNLPGLRPIIVKRSASLGNQFLLTDNTGAWFLWNDAEPELWRFNFGNNTKRLADVVEMVRTNAVDSRYLVQQFNPDTGPGGRRPPPAG